MEAPVHKSSHEKQPQMREAYLRKNRRDVVVRALERALATIDLKERGRAIDQPS